MVFVQNNVKFIDATNVIPAYNLKKWLKNYNEVKYTESEMKNLYDILINNKKQCTITAKEHIEEIKKLKNDIENNICPRCGGKLVERHSQYGTFYGCENYPKCKFIKKN